jgi:GNAT superfamily N-acetyltransferase
VPRSAARVEEVGPFTLFVGTGAWPYYARPRLGLQEECTAADVEAVRRRQRELNVPETFEWAAWRMPDISATVRILEPGDDLATARAVQDVAFTHGGTAAGPEGIAERDAVDRRDMRFVRERIERGLSVMAVAEVAGQAVAAGMHQPVGPTTEIVGVATLPAVRRQGLGGAITGALVEHALANGAQTVFLSAGSEDIARVYARIGFRRIGTACIVG